jgi:surface polysaccharide O-acyltransferase-like enzyme
MSGSGGEKIEYIDVLRVISMISVVFLHTAAGSLRANIGSAVWHLSNVFTAVMGTSVPVFFMISGALVLHSPKTLSIKYMWEKRFVKIFVPFVVWSLVAVAYFEVINLINHGSVRWDVVLNKLKNAPGQPTTVHLWFMYALIPLYMLSPLLKKMLDALTKDLVRYLIILSSKGKSQR